MLAKLVSTLLLLLFATSALSVLIPYVHNKHFSLTPLSDTKYSLRIHHLDGTIFDQVVEKIGPGNFQLRGRVNSYSTDRQNRSPNNTTKTNDEPAARDEQNDDIKYRILN